MTNDVQFFPIQPFDFTGGGTLSLFAWTIIQIVVPPPLWTSAWVAKVGVEVAAVAVDGGGGGCTTMAEVVQWSTIGGQDIGTFVRWHASPRLNLRTKMMVPFPLRVRLSTKAFSAPQRSCSGL